MKVAIGGTWLAVVIGLATSVCAWRRLQFPSRSRTSSAPSSDLYFTTIAVKEGRFGKIGHNRDVAESTTRRSSA